MVLLADGSLFRGSIAELVKDDHVVIVTLVGDTRRFSMADVRYAGRAEDMPAPAESRAPTKRKESADAAVPVSFRAAKKGTTGLHVWSYVPRGASPHFPFQPDQTLCIAPCETTLPPGTYRFGVSGERGRVEHVPQLFEVFGPLSLEGSYHDMRRTRTAGWVLLGLFAVMGTVVAVAGESSNSDGLKIGGIVGGVVGVGLGLALGLQMDHANIVTVTPDAPGSSEE